MTWHNLWKIITKPRSTGAESSRTPWSRQRVPNQPWLWSKALLQTNKLKYSALCGHWEEICCRSDLVGRAGILADDWVLVFLSYLSLSSFVKFCFIYLTFSIFRSLKLEIYKWFGPQLNYQQLNLAIPLHQWKKTPVEGLEHHSQI